MIRVTLAGCLLVVGCGTHDAASGSGSGGFHIALGDATVFELVDRRLNKLDKPRPDLVLHPDGNAELINDKTGKPWMTYMVKPDGTVMVGDKPIAILSEHGITDPTSHKQVLELDGDTASLAIDGKTVKVVLASDGNITVLDRPDGNKWRIDAKDPAVMRTAFLVLGLSMKVALD
jgi:hypothetical protein